MEAVKNIAVSAAAGIGLAAIVGWITIGYRSTDDWPDWLVYLAIIAAAFFATLSKDTSND